MTRNRRAIHRASSAVVESIERRVMLDATYHSLALDGDFTQNWSDTSLITSGDDWSDVPSIIGYRGDALTGGIGTDPQTILAFGTGVVDVNANQTSPDAFGTGGVSEFEIANPVVALQGSATADAPFLLLHLNTVGMSSVSISYLLRDIDGNSDDAVQQVALQYRIGETGDFTNVPAGYVADASDGPNLTKDTPVNVTLPAETAGVSQLQVRIITTNAGSSDENIGIDDIVVPGINNPAGKFSFVSKNVTVGEPEGTVTLQVQRVGGSVGPVSVQYATVAGTATSPADFTAQSGVLNWADGDATPKNITISIADDFDPEAAESFTVELSNPVGGASIGPTAVATVSIADNDAPPPAIVLNEVNVNPPGTDNPFEYVEIKGTPGATLTNTYFVSVEGEGGGAGLADRVINLSSATIGASGLLVLKSPTSGFTIPAGTNVLADATFDVANGGLENGSNSFLLIFSPTPIASSTDLDPENDGTLNLPAGASLIDGIGLIEGDQVGIDQVYGAVLALGITPPNAVSRFVGNNNVNDVNAWFGGALQSPSTVGNATIDYEPLASTLNLPSGAYLTPGAKNYELADNPDGRFSFAVGFTSTSETISPLQLEVRRLGGTTGTASVRVTTADVTATAGSDYTAIDQVVTFNPGESSKLIDLSINDDASPEANETLTVTLSDPTVAVLAARSVSTVEIVSEDVATAPSVVLNEVLADVPGAGDYSEYAEIRGTAGASLVQTYFVSIEGDGSGAGIADRVIDLGAYTLGSNGLLVLTGTGTPIFTFPPEANVASVFGSAGGYLENGSNSFAIIFSPDAPITATTDLDLDNDGVFDNLPTSAVILDAIGWKDTNGLTNDDRVYGVDLSRYDDPNAPTTILFSPDAGTRFPNDLTPNSAAAWYVGDILSSGLGQLETQYDPAELSSNAPTGTPVITPGAANYPQPTALKGDMNGDNEVNNQDIAPFVLALTNYPQYQVDYPGLDGVFRGDIDNDSVLNNQDIAPFVALLTGPRPTTPFADATRVTKRLPIRGEGNASVLASESTTRVARGVFATTEPVLA